VLLPATFGGTHVAALAADLDNERKWREVKVDAGDVDSVLAVRPLQRGRGFATSVRVPVVITSATVRVPDATSSPSMTHRSSGPIDRRRRHRSGGLAFTN